MTFTQKIKIMEYIEICPFCKEHKVVISNDNTFYHCNGCETDFTEDDVEHELLRQQISCVCSGEEATEEKPIDCTKDGTMLIIGNSEAQGLSELEKPQVTSVFQDYDGIVWVNIYGSNEPIEVDDLDTLDLQNILDYLQENYGYVTATDYERH